MIIKNRNGTSRYCFTFHIHGGKSDLPATQGIFIFEELIEPENIEILSKNSHAVKKAEKRLHNNLRAGFYALKRQNLLSENREFARLSWSTTGFFHAEGIKISGAKALLRLFRDFPSFPTHPIQVFASLPG